MTTHRTVLSLLLLLAGCVGGVARAPQSDMGTDEPDIAFLCTSSCSGQCVDTRYDVNHCGGCGKACPTVKNGKALCNMGTCATARCDGTFRHCSMNAADGCETDTASAVEHCGGCNLPCEARPNATAGCANSLCTTASCGMGFDDCNKVVMDGCEVNLQTDDKNCGACGNACKADMNEICENSKCVPNPSSFVIVEKKDINYSGIDYFLLKVTLKSATSVSENWCREYQKLCEGLGAKPTGCGSTYTSMNNPYGTCRSTYLSDGVSNTLSCNPSGPISNAARTNGYADANENNSFGFHYCQAGANACSKTLCSGNSCNSAISYIDANQKVGYTLCKK